jgi:hypothetical protein
MQSIVINSAEFSVQSSRKRDYILLGTTTSKSIPTEILSCKNFKALQHLKQI